MTREELDRLINETDRLIQPALWAGKTYREFYDWYGAQCAQIEGAAKQGMLDEDRLQEVWEIFGVSLECGDFMVWNDEPDKLSRVIRR